MSVGLTKSVGTGASIAALMIALGFAGAAQAEDEIVVTGTSLRGTAASGAAPVSVDRATLMTSGAGTPTEALRQLPQISGLGFDEAPHTAQNGAGNVQRGQSISLRGLAPNATLVLIDGRRVAPTGSVFSFTEANQLPLSAIERIEVLADGASAIYGSDAIAGVVNYIPRKRFDGLELTTRYSTNDHFDGWGGSLMAGRSWDGRGLFGEGHVVAVIDRDHRDGMMRGQSPFLRNDLRPFGGNDGRTATGTAASAAPGNIIIARSPPTPNPLFPTLGNSNIYGVPAAFTGAKPAGSQLLVNQPNLVDASDFTTYTPATERWQGYLSLEQALGDLTLSYAGSYASRKSTIYSYAVANRPIGAANPFYVSGIPGVSGAPNETVSFSFFKDIGLASQYIYDDTYTQSLSGRYSMQNGWNAELSFSHSRDMLCANCIEPLNNNIRLAALDAEIAAGRVNPFSATPLSHDELALFLVRGRDVSRTMLMDTRLKFDGPVFDLPGGAVRAAFGAEHLFINGHRTAIGIQATTDTIGAFAERRVDSFFAETLVPVVGEANAVPLVKSLTLNLAGRLEKYSDFGQASNPRIGFSWRVDDDLSLRGTWGASFRAPNLIEMDPSFFSRIRLENFANGAGDPAIPVTNTATRTSAVVQITGSNAALVPEKATTYTLGFDFSPRQIAGLKLSATYYNIDYTNQIIGLQGLAFTFLANARNRAIYAPYITAAPQPSTCVNGQPATYNPLYASALAAPSLGVIDQSQFCSATAIVDSRNANASSTRQDGLDVSALYRVETGAGALTASVSGAKIFNNRQIATPGGPVLDQLDLINTPVSLRLRGGLGWEQGPFGAAATINYVGGYTNNLPITVAGVVQPVRDAPDWTTLDLAFFVDLHRSGRSGWPKGLRLGVNIVNALDRDPPVVLSTNALGAAFDNQVHNIFGRQVSVQLSKTF